MNRSDFIEHFKALIRLAAFPPEHPINTLRKLEVAAIVKLGSPYNLTGLPAGDSIDPAHRYMFRGLIGPEDKPKYFAIGLASLDKYEDILELGTLARHIAELLNGAENDKSTRQDE